MKNIKNIASGLMVLLFCSIASFSFGQDAMVEKYHQVMKDFLSHDCMSFEMTTVQYADMEGTQILEEVIYQVVKSNDIWYLTTGKHEVLFSDDFLVSIDNASQMIHVEKKHEINPAQIFSNPSGMEKVFEYLQLEGAERTVIGGRKLIEFTAPSGNQTSIQLEYDEVGPKVERITATIDMTTYDELDSALDGRKIESTYAKINLDACQFDTKVAAIVDSEFSVLLNKKRYQGYLIN